MAKADECAKRSAAAKVGRNEPKVVITRKELEEIRARGRRRAMTAASSWPDIRPGANKNPRRSHAQNWHVPKTLAERPGKKSPLRGHVSTPGWGKIRGLSNPYGRNLNGQWRPFKCLPRTHLLLAPKFQKVFASLRVSLKRDKIRACGDLGREWGDCNHYNNLSHSRPNTPALNNRWGQMGCSRKKLKRKYLQSIFNMSCLWSERTTFRDYPTLPTSWTNG